VATAVAPFAAALVMRLFMGRSRFTSVLITLTTTWFAVNVLLAPLSAGMQQDLVNLRWPFH